MQNDYEIRRGCAGKTKHNTYEDALKERPINYASKHLGIYKCKFCGFYHVGRKNSYKNRSRSRRER